MRRGRINYKKKKQFVDKELEEYKEFMINNEKLYNQQIGNVNEQGNCFLFLSIMLYMTFR